jgi:L-lactate dehydrogenase complex protein LldG
MSREQILQSIRQQKIDPVELPTLERPPTEPHNLLSKFLERLEMAGGKGWTVESQDKVLKKIVELFPDPIKTYTNLSDLDLAKPMTKSATDPHDFTDIDVAVLKGRFGVAENGAVWITDEEVPFRSVYYAVQHLVLVIEEEGLVPNLFQAYELISSKNQGFGCFISGPSKTADIEQTLVMGAHGPRSVTVLLT